MWTLSYLTVVLGSLIFFVLGWLVNRLIRGKDENWQEKINKLENENKALLKKVKKEKSNYDNQKDKTEKWKSEFQVLKADLQNEKKSYLNSIEDKQAELNELQSKLKSQTNENQGLQRINDKLSKDLANLKEKYKTDLEGATKWRSEKESVEREINNLKSKLAQALEDGKKYKEKYQSQEEKFNDLKMIQRTMRALKAKNTKLETDVKYWEEMHYKAHHELAELKKTHEGFNSEYNKLEELRRGDEVLKSNLLKQLQEYKTKFLDINDKYRQLTSSPN